MKKNVLIVLGASFLIVLGAHGQDTTKVHTKTLADYESLAASQIGKQVEAWSLADVNGKMYNSSEYSGKLLLIEFWGAGCPACIMAAKDVSQIDSLYKSIGLAVIGIEGDGRSNLDQIKDFKKRFNMNYLCLINGKEVSTKLGVGAYPTFFLLDKKGKIVYSHVGYFYGDTKNELINLIEKNK
jgi:peroxiredoxin